MKYHKIQSVYKRDPETNYKTLIDGAYSLPEFEYLANNSWTWTEKVDGTNIRVMYASYFDRITFGGKTDRAQIPAELGNNLNAQFLPQLSKFQEIFNYDDDGEQIDIVLYGEGYGAKIQKPGGLYRPDQGFVLFDVKVGHWWLQRKDVEEIGAELNTSVVPIVGVGSLPEMVEFAQSGYKSTWGDFKAEGIVARPTVELKARNGGRIITKVKFKDFI